MLCQTLILNKTDTLALFSLPHDKMQNMKKVPYLKKAVRKFLITYPMIFIQKNHAQRSKTNHRQFAWIKGKILESNPDPDVLYFKKTLSSEQLATV